MRVYLILIFILLGCTTSGPLTLTKGRGPASILGCKDLIEGILGSYSVKSERAYLLKLSKRLKNLELEDVEYLERKLVDVADTLSARKAYLVEVRNRAQQLDSNHLFDEAELLEDMLARAPPVQRVRSLQSAFERNNEFTDQQVEWMKEVITYLRDDLAAIKVRKIGKQSPINSQYAGARFPMEKLSPELKQKYPHGVWFDRQGFPLFNVYATRIVEIDVSGAGRFDFMRANAAAGIERLPDDLTWHHHQDGKSMVLMPRDIHDAIKHSGGVAFVTKKIQRVKGALPAGTEWAGKLYPIENLPVNLRAKYPRSVRYKVNGHPDLNPYTELSVEIESTGRRQLDFREANRVAGIDGLPAGMTWHLKEDGKTMQMVPRELLKAIPNTTLW